MLYGILQYSLNTLLAQFLANQDRVTKKNHISLEMITLEIFQPGLSSTLFGYPGKKSSHVVISEKYIYF